MTTNREPGNRGREPHANHPAYRAILARRAQAEADAALIRQETQMGIAASKCFDRYRTADRVNCRRAEELAERRAMLNRRMQMRMDAQHAIEMSRGIATDATAMRIWTPIELAAIVCRRHGTSVEYLTARNEAGNMHRDTQRTELRRRVYSDMAEAGTAYAEIARIFGTNHSSIITAIKAQRKDSNAQQQRQTA